MACWLIKHKDNFTLQKACFCGQMWTKYCSDHFIAFAKQVSPPTDYFCNFKKRCYMQLCSKLGGMPYLGRMLYNLTPKRISASCILFRYASALKFLLP
jgi:hypothetical protein